MTSAASQAQTASGSAATTDESLTWHGITLYGIIDAGIQYDTHAAPINDYFFGGTADLVQKNSNGPIFGVTPNNLSQSRIGLQGKEPLGFMDWSGVFKLETFFNPQSGQISDALKSVTQNNGRSLADQSTNVDSSIAGQAFEQAFVGLSSPTWGTITFGRQNSVLADGVGKYDPQAVSNAFSVIGLSGTAAGGGDTQDRRLDSSIKYAGRFADLVRVGLQYKFQNSSAQSYATAGSGEAFSAYELSLGADYAGLSVDGYYAKVRDAVSVSPLSAAQVAGLATGFSLANSLAGTISDNATYGIMGLYAIDPSVAPVTFSGGYEHITFMNPSIALNPGFDDVNGYVLAVVNNTAYAKADKILQVYWAGAKYAVSDNFNAIIAYYGYKQNAYATGKNLGCSDLASSACSGNLHAVSIAADYHFTKRFDAYAGAMWSNVSHGLAFGYLNTTNVNPTIGARFSF
ncbi:MAG TPA: porin [Steroidobacteraceae bacterium]|nr:porin [Steroidobacteraceae bacterium]